MQEIPKDNFEEELPKFGKSIPEYEPPKLGALSPKEIKPLNAEHPEDIERELAGAQKEIDKAFEHEERIEVKKEQPEYPEDIEKMIAEAEKEINLSFLFGDFRDQRDQETGQIILAEEQRKEVAKAVEQLKEGKRFSPPSLLKGALTATEYDSKTRNFSTRTEIITLESGQKVFVVYNYPASWIHRAFDAIGKKFSGDKMSKASSSDWKKVFESRSNVPTIECNDPNVVLMPYLPNVNAHDLLARNKEIKNFGPCPWAKDMDLEGKVEIGGRIINELERVHNTGKTWGETILPNMIVTPEGKPVIVDPETRYKKGVKVPEQKARDLRDILMSVCGALHYSENDESKSILYKTIVSSLLDRYSDASVIEELKGVVSQKPTMIQKMFRGFYETARLGISVPEYEKVAKAIESYRRGQQQEK